jgi:chromosome segregation ATPase
MISTIELNQLIQDRNNLIETVRTRDREIQCLQTQVRDHFDEVLLKENELKRLKEENEMLKQRLKHVEDQLAATTADLVSTRSTLASTTSELSKAILRIESLEVKQEFDKYVVSIQDINRAFELERKMSRFSNPLRKLRSARVESCHYINEKDDSRSVMWLKASKAAERIDSMSTLCREKFELKYGQNFLNEIKKYIGSIPKEAPCSDEESSEVDDFWNDF